ncbi:cbb3-type cytochrome c oxidase subunit 3 [Acuticoccus mangrovi]|uniref:Cbb3-type cytochrome c oxidase subunit 3 n=1 Tax=Acuticoccus mangrovi TaxID=2796142 RepID=A0A934IRV2_9HYPH|nr:cbb3-type cytochrome c oxidase subunit 3 [Acuticoccus mangrovi]MBJ3777488.1 cbb3-type cytochrome c oxidase subunit 3 [Acuticoccus mangrovi]
MSYEGFRHFADTWGLAVTIIVFAVLVLFLFRRGSTERYRQAARIPMDAPESPADSDKTINSIKAGEAGSTPDPKGKDERP